MFYIPCFQIYLCIAGAFSLDKNALEITIYVLSAMECFLYVPQFILELAVIYLGERRLANIHHRLYGTLQGVLSFLVIHNLMHWAVDSFLETRFLTSRGDLQQNTRSWNIFVQLFVPPCIYFRFLAMFLFLRVKNLMRQDEARNTLRTTARFLESTNGQRRTVYGTELTHVE